MRGATNHGSPTRWLETIPAPQLTLHLLLEVVALKKQLAALFDELWQDSDL
jgi:hypothetical protein